MALPDLTQVHIIAPDVADHLRHGRRESAENAAREAAAAGLSDLGVLLLQQNRTEAAIDALRSAVNACESSQVAFHNLVAGLFARKLLRERYLDFAAQFVADHHLRYPWVAQYADLLYAPRFLNVEFVSGKCNLNCRMCRGTNSPTYPDRLSYLSADDFERMLEAAPTAFGITLSAGDSDPLLHPEFERILDSAARHHVTLDIFTNGHPLNARKCRRMVETQAVGLINFSIDAATPETYRRIRGASFERVLQRIEMLEAMKKEAGRIRPELSLSFVAMSDNIEELPEFVRLAQRWSAFRVFVEYLNGWDSQDGENLIPTNNPNCFAAVREAQQIAAGTKLKLILPDRLLHETKADTASSAEAVGPSPDPAPGAPGTSPTPPQLECCGWLRGIWVRADGAIDPCCLVHRVADMGNIHDGPLFENEKFRKVKRLLLAGKVFPECLSSRMCQYVQQQKAAGKQLELITPGELGDPTATSSIGLKVLQPA